MQIESVSDYAEFLLAWARRGPGLVMTPAIRAQLAQAGGGVLDVEHVRDQANGDEQAMLVECQRQLGERRRARGWVEGI